MAFYVGCFITQISPYRVSTVMGVQCKWACNLAYFCLILLPTPRWNLPWAGATSGGMDRPSGRLVRRDGAVDGGLWTSPKSSPWFSTLRETRRQSCFLFNVCCCHFFSFFFLLLLFLFFLLIFLFPFRWLLWFMLWFVISKPIKHIKKKGRGFESRLVLFSWLFFCSKIECTQCTMRFIPSELTP